MRLALLALACALLTSCGSSNPPSPGCDGVDCGAHGTCNQGACQCTVGFTGDRCQTCLPQCSGRQCGDDGCGGTCGTCPANGACTNGRCPCAPRCDGKDCGDDGCGGSCGPCTGGTCSASGRCCVPDCAGKTCGDDGCGDSCGRCSADQACIAGSCGVDNGLACVRRTETCDGDGDCGGAPNRCTQAPVMACGNEPDDCGTATTICRSVLQCWRSCAGDGDCGNVPGKPHCVGGLCQACEVDADCTNGAPCVNNNARIRCGSEADCPGVALNRCR